MAAFYNEMEGFYGFFRSFFDVVRSIKIRFSYT